MMRMRWLLGIGFLLTMLALFSWQSPALQAADEAGWRKLFNGKDLAGWDTWLGKPHKTVEGLSLQKNAQGEYTRPVGLDEDPTKVYTVVTVDGEPAIRISGEIFGALTTKDDFENYHFKLEFKWGDKKWPPREEAIRDSGILYHCIGEQGAHGSFWMQSHECQIQERDCGDYYSVAYSPMSGCLVDVEGKKNAKGIVQYEKGADKFAVPSKGASGRIIRSVDLEKPVGEWNTVEVICLDQTCIHIVNGKTVMVLTNSRRKVGDKETPLTKGKIQIQSEGAEVFYRNIAVRPVKAIPEQYQR